MELAAYLPFWDKLSETDRRLLEQAAVLRSATQGTLLHSGTVDCIGLLLVTSGQLRAFILSDAGKEVTLYRLFERDLCLFSASCMMSSIQFDVSIEVEQDASFWVIPADLYKSLMERSAPVANFTNQIMAARFSEVMWLVEQILWQRFDARLAAFLLEEQTIEGRDALEITHDKIAAHLGTAREVVTRMLRYFRSEGLVVLSRGCITLNDTKRLRAISGS